MRHSKSLLSIIVLFLIVVSVYFLSNKDTSKSVISKDSNFKNYGHVIKALSVFEGEFINRDGKELFYGVTRTGDHLRLFEFDLALKEVTNIWHISEARGSWCIELIGDKIYVGTYNPASLFVVNLVTSEIEMLSKIPDSKFVWDMVFHKNALYLGTYPNGKLFKYDIVTLELSDLDSPFDHQYIRSLSILNESLYLGLGTMGGLAEYDLLDSKFSIKNSFLLNKASFVYDIQVLEDALLLLGLDPRNRVLIYNTEEQQFSPVEDISTPFAKKKNIFL